MAAPMSVAGRVHGLFSSGEHGKLVWHVSRDTGRHLASSPLALAATTIQCAWRCHAARLLGRALKLVVLLGAARVKQQEASAKLDAFLRRFPGRRTWARLPAAVRARGRVRARLIKYHASLKQAARAEEPSVRPRVTRSRGRDEHGRDQYSLDESGSKKQRRE